ncbi:MAG TPA: response regulator [Anaerolineae bacterium]|nr:response regulator [Anaerolineae bacterium]
MKRFLLADDNSALRSALRLMLETRLNAPLVLEAGDHAHMIELSMAHQPDYLILDWELPGFDQHNCLDALRDLLPKLKIIVISARPEAAEAATSAQADAFISKTDPPAEILNAIQRLNGKA